MNSPAAIAAYLLYQICGDTNYLTKVENIFKGERAMLFDTATNGLGGPHVGVDMIWPWAWQLRD